MFVPSDVTEYIESLVPNREPAIVEIEKYAGEHGVPIMELVGIEAMLQFLRLVQPKSILEVGTAIGYSAIRMAKVLPNVRIVTIERDKNRYDKAIENIEKMQLQERITVIFGDALETGEQVGPNGPFDSIFIDAAKGQYTRFFELYSPMLSQNGVVFSDNILFRGLVAKNNIEDRRHKSLVEKIKGYNKWLMNHPEFDTTILTVGDGIAISRKR
ncbi:O-methyltransferase [Schinkia azotoformans]|uniref:O-methyltransferase n=1 Tax=Schinkia azotoformans TaxID=1454 RepID=UPI002E1D00E2|nr:O-methyltransferase [Schinkia azotoformans]